MCIFQSLRSYWDIGNEAKSGEISSAHSKDPVQFRTSYRQLPSNIRALYGKQLFFDLVFLIEGKNVMDIVQGAHTVPTELVAATVISRDCIPLSGDIICVLLEKFPADNRSKLNSFRDVNSSRQSDQLLLFNGELWDTHFHTCTPKGIVKTGSGKHISKQMQHTAVQRREVYISTVNAFDLNDFTFPPLHFKANIVHFLVCSYFVDQDFMFVIR